MTRVGYVRVNTKDLDNQIARLKMTDCKIVRSETGPDALRIGRGMMLAAVAGSLLLLSGGSYGQTAGAAGAESGHDVLALCQIGIELTRSHTIEYSASTSSLTCPAAPDAGFALNNVGDGAGGVTASTAHVTIPGDGFSQIVDIGQAVRAADTTEAINSSRLYVIDQAVNTVAQTVSEEAETKATPEGAVVAQSGDPLTTGGGVDALLWDSGADGAAQPGVNPNSIADAPQAVASSSTSSPSSPEAIGELQPGATTSNNLQPDASDKPAEQLDDQVVKPSDEPSKAEISLEGAGGLVPPGGKAGVSGLEAVNVSQIKGATDVFDSGSGIGLETDGSIIVPTYVNVRTKTVVHKIGDAMDQIDNRVVSIVGNLPTANDTPTSTGRIPVAAPPKGTKNNNTSRGGSPMKDTGSVRKPAVLRAPGKVDIIVPPRRIDSDKGKGGSKYWVDGD